MTRSNRFRTLLFILTVALTAWTAGPLAAQDAAEPDAPTITDIRIEGDSARRVQSFMKLRVGDPYTVEAGNEDIRRIFDSGRYLDVTLTTEPFRDGVRVNVEVVRKDVVAAVKFVGHRELDEEELRSLAGIEEGGPVDALAVEMARRKIEGKYKLEGYTFVKVVTEREVTDDGVELVFTIREGPRVTVTDIEFTGNDRFPDRDLASRIATETYFPIIKPGIYNEETVARDRIRLIGWYRSVGFLNAEVTPELRFSPSKKNLTVIFHIEEGERFFVREIAVRGNTVFTDEEILEVMTLEVDEPFDQEGLKIDVESIRTLYGSKGYLDTIVEGPEQSYVGENGLRLTYTIEEGSQYRVGMIDIVTLQATTSDQVKPRHTTLGDVYSNKTKDKVIRRELLLYPGEVFDIVKLDVSRMRLQNLGYFSEVDVDIVPTVEEGVRDVRVTVKERDTGEIRFGAGFGSNAGLIGEMSMRQNNFDIARVPTSMRDLLEGTAFSGAGQSLTLSLRPGTEVSSASISFYEPHLFDSDFSYDINLFALDHDRFDYDETRYGLGTGIGYAWTQFFSSRIGIRVEEIELHGISAASHPDILRYEGDTSLRSVVFSSKYDRRNRPTNTTSGYFLGHSVELATDALGSDDEFWKTQFTGSYFIPVYAPRFYPERKHVLSFTGRVGFGDGFGGTGDIPIFERFFAGGTGSIRGFRYRTVGPRWLVDDTPLGGQTLLTGTVEYTFPIVMVEESLRGVVFYDVGTVTADTADFDLATLRQSVGVGLRLKLGEQLPLAFDFGFPISTEPGDDEQIFSFTIGKFF